MLLLTVFLSLCAVSVCVSKTTSASDNHTVINFDELATTKGLGPLPSTYHHLSFSSFSILAPNDSALDGKISNNDLNCAVSSPNALIGSRPSEKADGASFEITSITAMAKAGLQPYFTLESFYVKPMDAPAPGTTIYVNGHSTSRELQLQWHVIFPSGYHEPFLVEIEKFSGEVWNEMDKVEIFADFGYDDLDWEFCLDDLKLQFIKLPEENAEKVALDEKPLGVW